MGYSPAQAPAASDTVASIRDGLTANPPAWSDMNTRQLKEFCNRFAGAKETLYGEPSNILVYSVGGKTFAYFKTSDPERWRFSTKVTLDRFVELTDFPGYKTSSIQGALSLDHHCRSTSLSGLLSNPYAVRNRFSPGIFTRPHFHPNDRFIVVVSGTWWVGTGANFDPDGTKPMPAGSFIVHYGGKVHYDGAKTEECEIIIYGMGPATSTRVGGN